MLNKHLSFSEYFISLLKKYQELHKKVYRQESFRIVEIISNQDEECIFKIQLIGKNVLFEFSPQEIAGNDQMLEGFSKKDIRTITYHATKEIEKPQYKILSQEFQEETNKTIFKIRKHGSTTSIEKTANQLSLSKELLNQLTQEEAHMVGYVTASEKVANEKAEIEALQKEK